MKRFVILAPVDLRAAANALAVQVNPDWGDGNLTVPLGPKIIGPVTHYGCAGWDFSARFETALAQVQAAGDPATLALLSALVIDLAEVADPRGHFLSVIAAQGLAEVRPVSVNDDAAGVLTALPGIGPALAAQIVAGRPWASVDDLSQIAGISAAMVSGWEGMVTV